MYIFEQVEKLDYSNQCNREVLLWGFHPKEVLHLGVFNIPPKNKKIGEREQILYSEPMQKCLSVLSCKFTNNWYVWMYITETNTK